MNVSAWARKRSGGKPFSRKGFPPLSFPRSLSQTPQPLFLWSQRRKEKAKQKETPMGDFALCGARQGLRVLDCAAFEKAGETFVALSPVRFCVMAARLFQFVSKVFEGVGNFFQKVPDRSPVPSFPGSPVTFYETEGKGRLPRQPLPHSRRKQQELREISAMFGMGLCKTVHP